MQKHLDETDELDERTSEVYEATTDEKDPCMRCPKLDWKQYEKRLRTDISERFRRFDVYPTLEAVNHEMTSDTDMQHQTETEKEI